MPWEIRKMTPQEIRQRDLKALRKKGGEAAVRQAKAEDAHKAALKHNKMSASAWNNLEHSERKARETVAKWKETEEKAKQPRMSRWRPTLSWMAVIDNPKARREGRPLQTPPPGTREATFHSFVESVRKQVEKPPNGQAGYAATTANKTLSFAKGRMKEVRALFDLPGIDFQTRVYCLDAAALITGICIGSKAWQAKDLRKLLADNEEWEGFIPDMLRGLSDEEIKRIREENVEGTLFELDLGDTCEFAKKNKIWPDFEKNTVGYFNERAPEPEPEPEPEPKQETQQKTAQQQRMQEVIRKVMADVNRDLEQKAKPEDKQEVKQGVKQELKQETGKASEQSPPPATAGDSATPGSAPRRSSRLRGNN